MSSSTFTCKIPILGSESVCILNSVWTSGDINLLLLHGNEAWCGKFPFEENEDIAELMEQLSLTLEDYLGETKNALTTHGGAANFSYTIEKNKFIWKKYVKPTMALKFGQVTISKVPVFNTFEKIIDGIMQTNIDISERLVRSDQQQEAFKKENLNLKNKLNELVEKKSQMEKTLYSSFLCLLNEKKKKIEELRKKCHSPNTTGQSDLLQNKNDDENSDTERGHDEDEQQCSSEIDALDSRDSLEMEDKSIYTLPKRSQVLPNNESIPGPSRSVRQSRNSGNNSHSVRSKGLLVSSKNSLKTKMNNKRPVKDSCAIGKIKEETSSNEDPFMFPKRSRNINSSNKALKLLPVKVEYDSGSDTDIDKTNKSETDIDESIVHMETCDNMSLAIKSEETDGVDHIKEDKVEQNLARKEENKKGILSENLNRTKKDSYKGFSSSTISILNQLV